MLLMHNYKYIKKRASSWQNQNRPNLLPPEARWSEIAKAVHTPEIGTILDKAMIAIEADNKSLKGVLPKKTTPTPNWTNAFLVML